VRALLPIGALLVALLPNPASASVASPDCLDAPISSAVMLPSSCLVTGPTSEVLAGVSAIDSRAGAVALAGGLADALQVRLLARP